MRSLLEPHPLSPIEIAGGLALTSGVLVFGLIFSYVYGANMRDAQQEQMELDAMPLIDDEIVSARFVRLGRQFDELPNREVPVKAHAPQRGVAISKRPRRRERPDAGVTQEEPDFSNLIVNAERQAFAEDVEQRELEGDPDGIEEGTEREAQAGNVYAGQIYAFFRRGWTVPATIPESERRDLVATVVLTVGENLEITQYRMARGSGNADFDESINARLEAVRAGNTQIPEPPLEVRPNYIGTPFRLRFRGRHASAQ